MLSAWWQGQCTIDIWKVSVGMSVSNSEWQTEFLGASKDYSSEYDMQANHKALPTPSL